MNEQNSYRNRIESLLKSKRFEQIKRLITLALVGTGLVIASKDAQASTHFDQIPEPENTITISNPEQSSEQLPNTEQTRNSETEYNKTLETAVSELFEKALTDPSVMKNSENQADDSKGISVELGTILKTVPTELHAEIKAVISKYIDELMVTGNIPNYERKLRASEEEVSAREKAEIREATENGELQQYILLKELPHFSPELVVRIALLVKEIRAGLQKDAIAYNNQLQPSEKWKMFDPNNPLVHPRGIQTPARFQMVTLLEHLGDNNELTRIQKEVLRAVLTMPNFWDYLEVTEDGDTAVTTVAMNGILGHLNKKIFNFEFARDGAEWGSKINNLYGWQDFEALHQQELIRQAGKETFSVPPGFFDQAIKDFKAQKKP